MAIMRELLVSNDLVLLSFVSHILNEAGIEFAIFDGYTSAVEGSIGAIPRRVMVAERDYSSARSALGNASLTIPD